MGEESAICTKCRMEGKGEDMNREEIKSMSFEAFKDSMGSLDCVHMLEATGKEVYSLYKHDVCYVNRDGVERTLQLIVPEMKEGVAVKLPALLYVQGSAWMKQDQYKRLGVMARFAQRGFVTAILQYRESEIASFPAPIEDTKTGIRFLRKHAEEYHIDPAQVFLMGDSSGGHTAFLAAFTADEDVMDTDVYSGYSCKVKALVDFYGVSGVRIKEDFPGQPGQGTPESPEGIYIGRKDIYEHPELSEPLSCVNYVREEVDSPPVLMMHGEADPLVGFNHSVRLFKKLLEEGKDVTFYPMKNAVHGDVAFWTEENMDIVEAFLKKHMEK